MSFRWSSITYGSKTVLYCIVAYQSTVLFRCWSYWHNKLLPITYGWLIELSDFIRVHGKYYFRDSLRICKYHNVRRILLWESHNKTAMYRIALIAWSVLNLTIYLVIIFLLCKKLNCSRGAENFTEGLTDINNGLYIKKPKKSFIKKRSNHKRVGWE